MSAKTIRQDHLRKIWGRAGRLDWSKEKLHNKLKEWEFGSSLSAMNTTQLEAVRHKIEAYYQSVKGMDAQGNFMMSLMYTAAWNPGKLNSYMQKRFKCNKYHTLADKWRNLTQQQRRGIINMFKNMQK